MKLAQLTALAAACSALLPLAVSAIDAVEVACPSATVDAKLDAVKGILSTTVAAAGQVEAVFEDIWPALSGVVGAVQSLKATVAAAPAAAPVPPAA